MIPPAHGMREHHIAVRRTARYYTIGSEQPRELWFVIHGYSQLAARFLRRFQPIDDGTRLIVAPEALNRYYFESAPGEHAADAGVGATWMTREDRLADIEDYVAYLDSLAAAVAASLPAPPERTIVLGFSQGVATAARWIARGSAPVDKVVLWAGWLPPELAPGAGTFRGAALTWVVGRADGFTPEARVSEASKAMRSAGLDHVVHWHEGGHRIEARALHALAQELAGAP